MALTREEILSKTTKTLADLPRVEVQAFGGTVYVRAMTANEKDAFEIDAARRRTAAGGDDAAIGFRSRVVAWTCCNAEGSRLFEFEDADALGKCDIATIDRLFEASDKLNGFTGRYVADAEKNLIGTNGGASSSS